MWRGEIAATMLFFVSLYRRGKMFISCCIETQGKTYEHCHEALGAAGQARISIIYKYMVSIVSASRGI